MTNNYIKNTIAALTVAGGIALSGSAYANGGNKGVESVALPTSETVVEQTPKVYVRRNSVEDAVQPGERQIFVFPNGKEIPYSPEIKKAINKGIVDRVVGYIADETKSVRSQSINKFLETYQKMSDEDKAKYLVGSNEKGLLYVCVDDNADSKCDEGTYLSDPVTGNLVFPKNVTGHFKTEKIPGKKASATYTVSRPEVQVIAEPNTKLEEIVSKGDDAMGIKKKVVNVEKEVPTGNWEVSAGPYSVFGEKDSQFGYNGKTWGGEIKLMFSPRESKNAYGLSLLGQGKKTSVPMDETPTLASSGPLKDRLEVVDQVSNSSIRSGAGATFNIKRMLGKYVGLEGQLGFSKEWISRTSNVASYHRLDGQPLPGSDSSGKDPVLSGDYSSIKLVAGIGVPLRAGPVCVTPSGKAMIGPNNIDYVVGVTVGNCKKAE